MKRIERSCVRLFSRERLAMAAYPVDRVRARIVPNKYKRLALFCQAVGVDRAQRLPAIAPVWHYKPARAFIHVYISYFRFFTSGVRRCRCGSIALRPMRSAEGKSAQAFCSV